MAASANASVARPVETGDSFLAALLQTAINFLARAENRQPVAKAVEVVEAPMSNDVDLWKLYWTTVAKGSNSPKVRQMIQCADDEE